MKRTAFSLADKLEEVGKRTVIKRPLERRGDEVLYYQAADMIRSLSIKLHRTHSFTRCLKWSLTLSWLLFSIVLSIL